MRCPSSPSTAIKYATALVVAEPLGGCSIFTRKPLIDLLCPVIFRPDFPVRLVVLALSCPAELKRNDCRSGHSDRCECASFPLAAIPTLFRAHLKCSRPSDVSFVSDCILVGSAQLRRTWLRSRLPSLPWSAAPEGFATRSCLACIDETTERTIAPAARTAMPVLQLGYWIDAKRRERAYKRQDKKSALGAKPTPGKRG